MSTTTSTFPDPVAGKVTVTQHWIDRFSHETANRRLIHRRFDPENIGTVVGEDGTRYDLRTLQMTGLLVLLDS